MSLLSRLAVQAARAYGMLVSGATTNVSASYLVVAGGGAGGGGWTGGGGGAGGMLTSTATLSTLNTYSVTVGAGGTGSGSNGSNSSLSGTGLTIITSIGGGGGITDNSSSPGNTGGSGGGNGYNNTSAPTNNTAGQGNSGGAGSGWDGGAGTVTGGGGGGAGGAGVNGVFSNAGDGGVGAASSISGSSVFYAGGGGGGGATGAASPGGTGGGGAGGVGSSVAGTAGTANTGGGGGGFGRNSGTGASGGSGIVIISYTSATPRFVGGTLTTSGGNQIHTFTSSGTLSPITPITASYLVVAGGGGSARQLGGFAGNGGGGAGGLLSGSTTIYSGATYVVTVGAGGAGGTTSGVAPSGSNSVLSGTGLTTLTSTGGGGGGGSTGTGANGGSGGGGSGELPRTAGTGTSGQGNNGGAGVNAGGGGGGAGAAGSVAVTITGGAGGVGTSSSISGTATFYAGGGGGGAYSSGTAGTGGNGGGGNGGAGTSNTGNTPGTANTGGGAGGTAGDPATAVNGQTGGSGVVIISYAGSQAFNGGLVTSSGGNTIHTFTSTGALTPLTNNLTNSLRFRNSASAYLSRTPTVAGSRTTWTWSGWVKRGRLTTGSIQGLFAGVDSSSNTIVTGFRFTATDALELISYNTSYTGQIVTTQVFRDPSAWYHLVAVYDTTQATAANRTRIYVNGQQVTAFSTATYPSQNYNGFVNTTGLHVNGAAIFSGVIEHFDGYMDDIYFIDGQALEPYFFGNNDANGVWKPILYKGTYGTNGFYLNFSNTTSTTTLGFDSSPNGNNWTTNNISLTAGTTYDAMTDVPTNTSATTANYSTLNPLKFAGTLSNANLNLTATAASWQNASSTLFVNSGKWYFEATIITRAAAFGCMIGIGTPDSNISTTYGSGDTFTYLSDGTKYGSGSFGGAYGATFTAGDVIGVAFDCDARTITFYKNNVSQGTAFSNLVAGSFYGAWLGVHTSASSIALNCGQRPFTYTPPTGFVALNTFNL